MDDQAESMIRNAAIRYGAALDARRLAEVVSCLDPDVEADYDGRLFHGRDAVMGFLLSGADDLLMVYHFLGSINCESGPGLAAEIYVQSFAIQRSDPSVLLARGTRWLDDYLIKNGRCVISRSIHRTDWAVQHPVATFTPTAERTTWPGLA
jgi:SnoaL-like domain